jgi:hypothetical protein
MLQGKLVTEVFLHLHLLKLYCLQMYATALVLS